MITAKEALEMSKVTPVNKIIEEIDRMVRSACDNGYTYIVLKGEEYRKMVLISKKVSPNECSDKEFLIYSQVVNTLESAGFKLEQHWTKHSDYRWHLEDICLKISWGDV